MAVTTPGTLSFSKSDFTRRTRSTCDFAVGIQSWSVTSQKTKGPRRSLASVHKFGPKLPKKLLQMEEVGRRNALKLYANAASLKLSIKVDAHLLAY